MATWEEYKARLAPLRGQHCTGWRIPPSGPPSTWLTDDVLERAPEAVLHEAGLPDGRRDSPAELKRRAGHALEMRLRPEDRTEEPGLRFLIQGGESTIVDWNRALADLTGISRTEVVGRSFKQIIAPLQLSPAYRAAALHHVRLAASSLSDGADVQKAHPLCSGDDREDDERRAERLFPLPLPVQHTHGKDGYWVELLVTRQWSSAAMLMQTVEVRNALTGDVVTQLVVYDEPIADVRHKIASSLGCSSASVKLLNGNGEVLPDACRVFAIEHCQIRRRAPEEQGPGGATVEPQRVFILKVVFGSLMRHAGWLCGREFTLRRHQALAAANKTRSRPPLIGDTSTALQRAFVREVCHLVRQARYARTRRHDFSRNWKDCPETATLYHEAVAQLKHSIRGERTVPAARSQGWRRPHDVWKLGAPTETVGFFELREFLHSNMAALSEQENRRHVNGPAVVPYVEDPYRALLTIKVNVVLEDTRCRYDDWRPTGAQWAVINIPATLSMWQLHRVVVQAMTASSFCGGTLHSWSCKNALEPDSAENTVLSVADTHPLQLVQRLALDGVVVTQEALPLGDGPRHRMNCCEHRTSACAVLSHPGACVRLVDGFTRYGNDYWLTLQSVTHLPPADAGYAPGAAGDEASAMASSGHAAGQADSAAWPHNIGLPVVISGKPVNVDAHWSVEEANDQLHNDRRVLRKDFSFDGFEGSSIVLPWCEFQSTRRASAGFGGKCVSVPTSLRARGGDGQPMALCGEPPFSGYAKVLHCMTDPNGRTAVAEGCQNDIGMLLAFGDGPGERPEEADDELRALLGPELRTKAKKRPAAAEDQAADQGEEAALVRARRRLRGKQTPDA